MADCTKTHYVDYELQLRCRGRMSRHAPPHATWRHFKNRTLCARALGQIPTRRHVIVEITVDCGEKHDENINGPHTRNYERPALAEWGKHAIFPKRGRFTPNAGYQREGLH